jgi:hypothetical protein
MVSLVIVWLLDSGFGVVTERYPRSAMTAAVDKVPAGA